MKLLITGDWHFRGANPRGRMDNYQEAITRKLYEVFDLARAHHAEAIIIPGDLFDSPGTSLGTIADLASILQAAPCQLLAIHGNHDIWGGNGGSKYRTPFGLLARLGLINDLEQEPYETVTLGRDAADLNIAITGHGFDVETDTEAGAGQFTPPPHGPKWSGVSIHVIHSMLLEKAPGFQMRHTRIEDVQTTAQVIISGHDHAGFGIHRREDGVLFINPGALCRLSAHPVEMERQVQVALLTVENGHVEAELIPLVSAQPGHIVLSREHLEAEAEREERINNFLGLLSSDTNLRFLETADIIEQIAASDQLPQPVVSEALRRLGQAREELGAAYHA